MRRRVPTALASPLKAHGPAQDSALQCVGIAIPSNLIAHYFGSGPPGHEALRSGAATFVLTWRLWRFMLCLSHVDGLHLRM